MPLPALDGVPVGCDRLVWVINRLGGGGEVRVYEQAVAGSDLLRRQVMARDERDRRLLAGLGAVPGIRLASDDLRLICDVTDAQERLVRLAADGLVRACGDPDGPLEVYDVGPDVALAVGSPARQDARRQLRDFLTIWATGPGGGSPAPRRLAAGLKLLQALATAREWDAALALSQALDRHLALSGRWEAWHWAMSVQLAAAQARCDPAARALALHQLGTRALCVGAQDQARELLAEALRLRVELHDREGTQVTRYNLSLVPPLTPVQDRPRPAGVPRHPPGRLAPRLRVASWLSAALLVALVAAVLLLPAPSLQAVLAAVGG